MTEIEQKDLDQAYARAEAQRRFLERARYISAALLAGRLTNDQCARALKEELEICCADVAKVRANG